MTRTVAYFADGPAFGGTEQVLLTLLAGLDRREWRSVLLHHPDAGNALVVDRSRDMGVETVAVPRMRGSRGLVQLPRLVRELRARRPMVFHAQLTAPFAGRYALLGAALAGVPAVVATQHLILGTPSPRAIQLGRLLSAAVGRYIAVSRDVARRLYRMLRVPAAKIRVVHNGIVPACYQRAMQPGVSDALLGGFQRPLVLTAARLDAQKDIGCLLDAATLVPEATFIIAGAGPERAMLGGRARERGLCGRVRFLGYRDDIPELLASCDLFVLPSRFEGLPLVVLEAMAAGKPVVASAVGGTSEAVLHGETGLLTPPSDPAALACAIRTVLRDPSLGERLGAAGRRRVETEFHADRMVRGVTAVYDELLKERGID